MRALMFLNGEFHREAFDHVEFDVENLVIGVDNGAAHAKACGLKLNILIGDFDSLSPEKRQLYLSDRPRVIEYPKEKDFTDFELALEYSLHQGVREIDLFAVLGGRIDHAFANLSVISSPKFADIVIRIRDKGLMARLIRPGEKVSFLTKSMTEFSLLPLANVVNGVEIEGAKWNLDDSQLSFGSATGISNIALDSKFSVGCKSGYLLVVIFDQMAKEQSGNK